MRESISYCKDIEGMARDMRNRLLVTLVLTIVIYLYAPMFVKLTGLVLPVPFGLSKDVLMFLLATPAVFYGGWGFLHRRVAGAQERRL